MSDVSNITGLHKDVTPDPYYEIIDRSVKKIIEKYGYAVRGNRIMANTAIYEDDLLNEEYRQVASTLGHDRVAPFKNAVNRRLKCFIAVDKNRNITNWQKVHWPCNCKSCPLCSARKAIERLRYPETIVMIAECNDRDLAVSTVREMNQVLKALDIDYIPVTTIPTHDDRNIILVACLRFAELNPLIDDNEVKQSIAMLQQEYPFLEKVNRLESTHKYEEVYVTKESKIKFTTTQLFQTMPEGRSTIRERGRKQGFYFDQDLGTVAYMTKDERQKKTDEGDKVIQKFNAPAASNNVPTNIKKNAVQRTIKRTSAHKERAAFFADDNDDIAYQIKRFSSIYIEELEAQGYPQPEVQVNVRLTQRDIDEFNKLVMVPKAGDLPENILDIEFKDLDRKTYGLKDQYEKIKTNLLAEAQKALKTNLTHNELAELIIGQIEVPPPD